jgi:uncharacterized membrane protein YkvA (DUF1232 family)
MALKARLAGWARRLKAETVVLAVAVRHPRVPWPAKVFGALVLAYALSPIDLIPDFIPVLGYLDEVILLPLAIALAIWLVPPDVMAEHHAAAARAEARPVSRAGAVFIVALWVGAAALLLWWLWPQVAW